MCNDIGGRAERPKVISKTPATPVHPGTPCPPRHSYSCHGGRTEVAQATVCFSGRDYSSTELLKDFWKMKWELWVFGHFVIIRFPLKELANLQNWLGFAKSFDNFGNNGRFAAHFHCITFLFTLGTNHDNFQKSTEFFSVGIQMLESPLELSPDFKSSPFLNFSCEWTTSWFAFGVVKEFWAAGKARKTQILKGLILAQQEELSETTHAATVFPVLCFLCPAAVPLLSMSQISNDRRVCAGCTKRACLWQLFLHLKLWMMGGLLGGGRQRCILHNARECL